MKPYSWILTALLVVGAATGGWFAAIHHQANSEPVQASKSGRKILRYQSPMHPWIKSDEPGKCTICGMDLAPVYEGEPGVRIDPSLVMLSSNSITVLHVETAPVTRQSITRTLRVAGTIDDNDVKHRRLSAYVDGRIEKLFINYLGQEVKEGEPMALFHSPMLLNLVREYQVMLHPPAAASKLLSRENDQMRQAAEQRLVLMGLSGKQIESLGRSEPGEHLIEILAPMSGTVVSREVYAGQYVKEGDRLFEIADFSTMWFRFDAYEQDLAWLRPGQSIRITTPSLPGQTFQAVLDFIDPNLNEATRSAKVRVELANPLVELNGAKHHQFLHRLYAEGQITIVIPDTLTIPRSAVLNSHGDPLVYVDEGGGAYRQQKVKLGRVGDDRWEVLAGLSEADRVVTSGNLLLDAQAQLNTSSSL